MINKLTEYCYKKIKYVYFFIIEFKIIAYISFFIYTTYCASDRNMALHLDIFIKQKECNK